MKKSKDVTLKDAIQDMLKVYRMDDKMAALRIQELWPEVIGKTGAKYTRGFRFKAGVLTITTDAPALRQEISMNKTLVMQNINERMGGELVTEIVLL
jgi:hypothetical protein